MQCIPTVLEMLPNLEIIAGERFRRSSSVVQKQILRKLLFPSTSLNVGYPKTFIY